MLASSWIRRPSLSSDSISTHHGQCREQHRECEPPSEDAVIGALQESRINRHPAKADEAGAPRDREEVQSSAGECAGPCSRPPVFTCCPTISHSRGAESGPLQNRRGVVRMKVRSVVTLFHGQEKARKKLELRNGALVES